MKDIDIDPEDLTMPGHLQEGQEYEPIPGKPGWFVRKSDGRLKLIPYVEPRPPSIWDIK